MKRQPDSDGWQELIIEMVAIKQLLAEADPRALWPHHLPAVAANEDSIRHAEQAVGEALDPLYRDFLHRADGWRGFFQNVDLFSTRDLIGSERGLHATKMMETLESVALHESRLRREWLLPIAASMTDLDLFVLTRRTAPKPGLVVWFAGGEIDRFANFREYFLAMIDYNRNEVAALRGKQDRH